MKTSRAMSKLAADSRLRAMLQKKAAKSHCTYKVSAVAFGKKGEVLGCVSNRHSSWNVLDKNNGGRPGTAKHAERLLLQRYSQLVKTIIVCRIGRDGSVRPIDPCRACRKAAAKLGVEITTVR